MDSISAQLKVSVFLACKSIAKGNKGTTVLTILILALVYVNLMFTSSVFAGMTESTENHVIDTLDSNIVIEPKEGETYIRHPDSVAKTINSVSGVIGTSAQYCTFASITHEGRRGVWNIRSINPADEMTVTAVCDMMIKGEYLSKSDTRDVIIGKEISGGHGASLEHLSLGGVGVGDMVEVTFMNGVTREYRVKGIFDTNFVQSNRLAYITEKEMESVLGVKDMASRILVRTDEKGDEDKYIKQFVELGVRETIKPWTVYACIVAILTKSFSAMNAFTGAIGFFVAGVTSFIVVHVNTVSKRKQMGILRAIGTKESLIIRSYVFQAVFYAVCGCIVGLVVMFAILVPYFIRYPLVFPMGDVTLLIEQKNVIVRGAGVIVSAAIAGFIPSWRAVRETIIDAIWGD